MGGIIAYLKKLSDFLRNEVWHDPKDAGRLYLFYYQTVRIILLTIHGLKNRMILLRASALSYSTLLAIVPLLAIAFSMLKGLGFHSRLEHVLINYLTAEQEELTSRIIEYIANTNFKALGAFGTALLIYASVMMISNVERTFNEFWGVPQQRSISRKISNYISVLFLGPFLMVLSTALIASFSSNTVVAALTEYEFFEQFFVLFSKIIPHAILWIAFTVMYILMPNTRVKFIPALIAGIICGSIWEGAFRMYTDFNIGVAKYNTIYGTFAVLPIFIIWLYVSWIIVLIGAQLSYAIQNVRSYQQEFNFYNVGYDQKEEMAVNIMLQISAMFHKGLPQANIEDLSGLLSIPIRLLREITRKLSDYGLLQEISEDEIRYQPAKNPGLISVLDVCYALRQEDDGDWRVPEDGKNNRLQELMKSRKAFEAGHLGKVTMMDLLQGAQ
ncbi:MAG: YihY family inner membrane protein [Desulfobacteraceae bacterium]|nr:YihY family inner membrane protein [Desulfobacteraceae bacterium]MBC2755347.1 YihY family inner membrane protein [Desulfobacteraceae bacterium]